MANDIFCKLMSLFGIPDIKQPGRAFDTRLSIQKEESSRHTYSYFTEDELKQLRSKEVIQWVYSDDTWNKKFDFVCDRERYIQDVIERGGKLNILASTCYESSFMEEVLKMSLYDIGELNSPITWGSRRAQKMFRKCVTKYNLIESIYRRFLKIQYAVLAFYKACDQHYLGVAFSTINRYHMAVSLDDYLKVYYEPATYKEKNVVGIYSWMPQIIPYIRFQLIDILELMGRSYYDIPCTSQTDPFNRWEDPILTIFNVVYTQFIKITKAFNQYETIPFCAMMIRDFLTTKYTPIVGYDEELGSLFYFKNLFFHHNQMESILLMDYMAGTIRSFEYLLEHPEMGEESEFQCQLIALYDLFQAIKTTIGYYEEIDQYILNKPGEITWHRELIYCTKYRNIIMDEYLKNKRLLFKKRVVNPHGLYQNPPAYLNTLFKDFETKIKDIIK